MSFPRCFIRLVEIGGGGAWFAKLHCLSGKFALLLTGIPGNFDMRPNSTAQVDNGIDSSSFLFSLSHLIPIFDFKSVLSKL